MENNYHYYRPDADVVEHIPDVDGLLARLLALPLVTESLEAWRPVRQNVDRGLCDAGRVEVLPAAPLAGVGFVVAHTRLLPLGLAERDALPGLALALLDAVRGVRHVLGLGALRLEPGAERLLLAVGVVGLPAPCLGVHELTVVATGRTEITSVS